jgi:hypothetical protein
MEAVCCLAGQFVESKGHDLEAQIGLASILPGD